MAAGDSEVSVVDPIIEYLRCTVKRVTPWALAFLRQTNSSGRRPVKLVYSANHQGSGQARDSRTPRIASELARRRCRSTGIQPDEFPPFSVSFFALHTSSLIGSR